MGPWAHGSGRTRVSHEAMHPALSLRGVLTALGTAAWLTLLAICADALFMLTYPADPLDVGTTALWRTLVIGTVGMLGTRAAVGVAARGLGTHAAGPVAVGLLAAGAAGVALTDAHLMFGEAWFERYPSRGLIDLVAWSAAGLIGLAWGQWRADATATPPSARGRAGVRSWS